MDKDDEEKDKEKGASDDVDEDVDVDDVDEDKGRDESNHVFLVVVPRESHVSSSSSCHARATCLLRLDALRTCLFERRATMDLDSRMDALLKEDYKVYWARIRSDYPDARLREIFYPNFGWSVPVDGSWVTFRSTSNDPATARGASCDAWGGGDDGIDGWRYKSNLPASNTRALKKIGATETSKTPAKYIHFQCRACWAAEKAKDAKDTEEATAAAAKDKAAAKVDSDGAAAQVSGAQTDEASPPKVTTTARPPMAAGKQSGTTVGTTVSKKAGKSAGKQAGKQAAKK